MTSTPWMPPAPGPIPGIDRRVLAIHAVPPLVIRAAGVTDKLARFLETMPETPFLAMDLSMVGAKYLELCGHFPGAEIYYAVKANPARNVVALLADAGSRFDVASPAELDLCLSLGVTPDRLSYGNTIKKASDIAYAFERGVYRFAFDSKAELRKLAVHAPGSLVMSRLQ